MQWQTKVGVYQKPKLERVTIRGLLPLPEYDMSLLHLESIPLMSSRVLEVVELRLWLSLLEQDPSSEPPRNLLVKLE